MYMPPQHPSVPVQPIILHSTELNSTKELAVFVGLLIGALCFTPPPNEKGLYN